MDGIELVRTGMTMLHHVLDTALEEMTTDQWNFHPVERQVSPFFLLWHSVRTEDIVVNDRLQRKDTVWATGGYAARLGLPSTGQGTGMTEEQADAVRAEDLSTWREYQSATWKATDDYLASTDEDFNRPVPLLRLDESGMRSPRPALEWLWIFCIHSHRHVGEIEYARGLQNLGNLTGL